MSEPLLLVHAAATWFMVGLIWFVQVVHYPLFAAVGTSFFCEYEARHQRLTTWVVLPPMLVELATAALLVVAPPADAPAALAWVGLALVALIWGSTFFVQVPCHRRLGLGFDAATARRLVRTNLVRALLWSARGAIAIALLAF